MLINCFTFYLRADTQVLYKFQLNEWRHRDVGQRVTNDCASNLNRIAKGTLSFLHSYITIQSIFALSLVLLYVSCEHLYSQVSHSKSNAKYDVGEEIVFVSNELKMLCFQNTLPHLHIITNCTPCHINSNYANICMT